MNWIKTKQLKITMNNNHEANEIIKDRYKISEVIGQGGMGCVYLAEDLRLSGRLCALKVVYYEKNLPPDVIKQTREQFKREATVLARLDHPNLPKVSDFFSDEDRDYLVMDYVPGKDLRALMLEETEAGENFWILWGYAILIMALVLIVAYRTGALAGRVRQGIVWAVSSLIGGLVAYNYLVLELPGVEYIFPQGQNLLLTNLVVLAGSFLGWLISFVLQQVKRLF